MKWGGIGLSAGVVLGVGLTLLIQLIVSGGEAGRQEARHRQAQQQISDALDTCGIRDSIGVEVTDGGAGVIFSSTGLYGVDFGDIECFGDGIGMPQHVRSEMYQTRALDGRQEAEWDVFAASWSYHPDDGLDVVFSVTIPDSTS